MVPSLKQKRYLSLAKRQALQSDFYHKHGAILISGGQILNTAHNKVVFNSFANRFRIKQDGFGTKHAEVSLILGLDIKVTTGCDIYVVRVNNYGNMMLSAPCPMCIDICRFVNIKRIFYSTNNNNIGVVKL